MYINIIKNNHLLVIIIYDNKLNINILIYVKIYINNNKMIIIKDRIYIIIKW